MRGNGYLYALSKDGILHRLSPRSGAISEQAGRVAHQEAAFGRAAIVNVATEHGAVCRGWTFLAASPSAIEAISLMDGRASTIYQPRSPEVIATNHSEADATAFRGIAANNEIVVFLLRSGAEEQTLAIKSLTHDRPATIALRLQGASVTGPLLCGPTAVFTTEKQIGVYDYRSRRGAAVDLPPDFSPELSPVSNTVKIAPGSLPLAVKVIDEGRITVCVLGEREGFTGLLEMDMEARTEVAFHRLPKGSSFATSADGTACLSLLTGVAIFSADRYEQRRLPTQPFLPAYWDHGCLISFGEVDFPEQHRLQIDLRSEGEDLRFESVQCNRESACGIFLEENQMTLAYLDIFAEGNAQGLRFAHWARVGSAEP